MHVTKALDCFSTCPYVFESIGRAGEIRTHDLLHPKQARYQAAPRPELLYLNTPSPGPSTWSLVQCGMSLKQGSCRWMQFSLKNLDQFSVSEMEELPSAVGK